MPGNRPPCADGQRGRVVVDIGGLRRQRRRGRHDRHAVGIPHAHLGLGDHPAGRDARPQPAQVVAERQRVTAESDRRGGGTRRIRQTAGAHPRCRTERELAVDDAHVVTQLGGAALQELPVGLSDLRDVLVRDAGIRDIPHTQPCVLGDLTGDVAVRRVEERPAATCLLQAVRLLVAADHGVDA